MSGGATWIWGRGDTVSWCRLTALVLRVLALSRPYLPVAASGPAASLRWVLGQQRPDGAFLEHRAVVHREMQVGDTSLLCAMSPCRISPCNVP